MEVEISEMEPSLTLLCLEGDLDFQASSKLREQLNALVEKQSVKILIDLAKVPYMDSSGIAAFVELAQKTKPLGGKVVFFNLSESVQKVFELARLNLFFPIAPSREDAITLMAS